MQTPLAEFVTAITAYLAGTIPFGLLVARGAAGIDIRQHGSGNIGATNVGRTLGAKWGVAVLLLDALKGALPVLLIPRLVASSEAAWFDLLQVIAGVATVVGHMFPVWLKFRGGKGVATAVGAMAVTAPVVVLITVLIWIAVVFITRIPAVGSLLGVILFALLTRHHAVPFPAHLMAIGIGAVVIVRHRSNIRVLIRRLRGKTPPAKRRAASARGPAPQPRRKPKKSSRGRRRR